MSTACSKDRRGEQVTEACCNTGLTSVASGRRDNSMFSVVFVSSRGKVRGLML